MTAIGTAAAVVDRLEPVPATFGAVFAVPEFRVLWLAQVLSVVGDQLAPGRPVRADVPPHGLAVAHRGRVCAELPAGGCRGH